MTGLPGWIVSLAWVPYYVYMFASSAYFPIDRYMHNAKAKQLATFLWHVTVETMPVASLGFVLIGADAVMREDWFSFGAAALASCVMAWLWHRHDKDTRWQRRRKRLLETVRRAGNRLAVVPTGGTS